jgi:murein DD-endopeptidase MepM/ murein hydrolase activator NlpD
LTAALYNPVAGFIHPKEWTRPSGNTEYRVTKTFADHVALGQHGVDYANGLCGGAILAVLPGVVHAKFTDSSGAKILRIRHDGGLESGYAHAASWESGTAVGAKIKAGQRLGYIGNTGALSRGCHLHFGFRTGVTNADPGTEVDSWPLLYQNRTAHLRGAGANLRLTPGTPGTKTVGVIYASSRSDGHIRRNADGKDLGLTSKPRGIRQPTIGATYTLDGISGNLWLPQWIDAQWLWAALPLVAVS